MWRVALTLGLLLALAPPAAAAPRLVIEDVLVGERFGERDRCYAVGSQLLVIGRGFAPRTPVRFGRGTLRPNRDGDFSALVTARTDRAQERITLRARQGTQVATLRFWAGVIGVNVPSWGSRSRPATGTPGKRERVRIGGFDVGGGLSIEYSLNQGVRYRARVATLRGPCGAAEFTIRQFPFSPVPDGLYRVSFSSRSASAWYPGVRIGPVPPPAVPLPSTIFGLPGAGYHVAATPDGGYLVAGMGRVDRVSAAGVVTRAAGTGVEPEGAAEPGGDGGPATAAPIDPSDVATLPDGGFLIAECDRNRIRRVDPTGAISTVASWPGCPDALLPLPDGALLVADTALDRIFRIEPNGTRTAVAGNGEFSGNTPPEGPALKVALRARDLALDADGSILIADYFGARVLRLAGGRLSVVAGNGTEAALRDDGLPATDAAVTPTALAARPGGGFYVLDAGAASGIGSEPRVRVVQPDGTILTLAGTGRFAPDPTRFDELGGDGMAPLRADLRFVSDLTVLTDGGLIFTEDPGRVRHLPPPTGGLLGVAIRRDADRIFAPGVPTPLTLRLSAPATVRVDVGGGPVLERELPAGETRVELPPRPGEPQAVSVTATDTGGRTASDRATLYPRGWLSEPLARFVAEGLFFHVIDASSRSGDGLSGCRRFGANRFDCALSPEQDVCRRAISVVIGADGHLRWGTYRCPIAPTARPSLQRLKRNQLSCSAGDSSCPPPIFGRVDDRWLVPWD
ncbi:hypothetical protein OJ998_30725 [Solirubrobacter taibaiensis]|nr:hypothetical protein [Solirubrobacter taibaiensis]